MTTPRRIKPLASIARTLLPCLLAFGAGYGFHACAPKSGHGISRASWMPAGASDGAYGHGGTFVFGPPSRFYEYTISEADFHAYALRQGWSLQEISKPVQVRRYLEMHVRPNEWRHLDEQGLPVKEDLWPSRQHYQETVWATVTRGQVYTWQAGDASLVAAFDRDRQRAFLCRDSR